MSQKADWRQDLTASRNLCEQQRRGFEMVLGWFEQWRLSLKLKGTSENLISENSLRLFHFIVAREDDEFIQQTSLAPRPGKI